MDVKLTFRVPTANCKLQADVAYHQDLRAHKQRKENLSSEGPLSQCLHLHKKMGIIFYKL